RAPRAGFRTGSSSRTIPSSRSAARARSIPARQRATTSPPASAEAQSLRHCYGTRPAKAGRFRMAGESRHATGHDPDGACPRPSRTWTCGRGGAQTDSSAWYRREPAGAEHPPGKERDMRTRLYPSALLGVLLFASVALSAQATELEVRAGVVTAMQ